jgi:hypothetical protein
MVSRSVDTKGAMSGLLCGVLLTTWGTIAGVGVNHS